MLLTLKVITIYYFLIYIHQYLQYYSIIVQLDPEVPIESSKKYQLKLIFIIVLVLSVTGILT